MESLVAAVQLSLLWRNSDIPLCRRRGGPRRQMTRMMAVGVPRVPFRSKKAGGWQWVDIWNCLLPFQAGLHEKFVAS